MDVLLPRITAIAGAALIVVGTLVPVNGGGRAGYPYAILDLSIQRELLLFAAEPIGVAGVAALMTVVVVPRAPRFSAGVMMTFGFQTGALFLAYLVGAAFGNPQYNSFEPGGLIGASGAGLLFIAGALLLMRTGFIREPGWPLSGRSERDGPLRR